MPTRRETVQSTVNLAFTSLLFATLDSLPIIISGLILVNIRPTWRDQETRHGNVNHEPSLAALTCTRQIQVFDAACIISPTLLA